MATGGSSDALVATPAENKKSSSTQSETSKSCGSPSSLQKSSTGGGADPKVCGVCGDKALGNNFNAITCESCKAFFRRNALRTKPFTCPFNNDCKVDAITRRFCQRCRLKKCFDIGMKKEWIMTEEEKKIKKQKIEQNRRKRSSLENSNATGEAAFEGVEDGDSADSVPFSKKSSLSSSDPQQRLSVPAMSEVKLNEKTNVATVGQGTSDLEETPHPPKNHKQPMGIHNQNGSSEQNLSIVSTPRRGTKGRSHSIITIEGDAQSPAPPSPAILSNYQLQHHSTTPAIDPAVPQHHGPEHILQQEPSNSSLQPLQIPSATSGWVEGESSSSSLSPPVPSVHHLNPEAQLQQSLVKYPPHKRPRIYEHHDEHVEENSSDNQPTPLLSSLIQPNHPESSPDYTLSPPAPQLVHSTDFHPNYEETEFHNQRNSSSYHSHSLSEGSPSTTHQVIRHHNLHQQQEYHEDYDRSPPQPQSPTVMTTYQNGYHHQYSPSPSYHSLESDNHYHYQDNRQQQEERQQVSMRMPPMNTMDSILSIAIAAEFNSFGMLGGNIPNSKDLNKAEQAKLNELLLASQALHAPVDTEFKIPNSSEPSLLNIINLTEIAIRRLIKMSKKISGFKNMCQEDQIALLKGGCTEMMILRSAVTYDPDRDSWQIPHSNPGYNINLGVLKEARGNLYEEHQRFVKSFRSQWRKDENIMIILCAITLFTPERHNVIHRDVVKLEQDSYYYLLKRYLESILNGCEAKSNYLQLIRKIAELRTLNSSHVRVFLEMNPKEVEPLLIEIFDLK